MNDNTPTKLGLGMTIGFTSDIRAMHAGAAA